MSDIISTAEDHDERGGNRSDRQIVAALILLHAERFLEIPSAILLDDSRITVGREHADLLLPDDSVSRSHATIERTGPAFTVHDRESKNGVLVGRTRINANAPTPIKSGDIVCF